MRIVEQRADTQFTRNGSNETDHLRRVPLVNDRDVRACQVSSQRRLKLRSHDIAFELKVRKMALKVCDRTGVDTQQAVQRPVVDLLIADGRVPARLERAHQPAEEV